jgi:hypothetical protein
MSDKEQAVEIRSIHVRLKEKKSVIAYKIIAGLATWSHELSIT